MQDARPSFEGETHMSTKQRGSDETAYVVEGAGRLWRASEPPEEKPPPRCRRFDTWLCDVAGDAPPIFSCDNCCIMFAPKGGAA